MSKTIRYGTPDRDGARPAYVGNRCIGRLMSGASDKTLEASPGIQAWSNPRGKVSTQLFDGGASVLNFSAYWERHYQRTYPLATPQG